MVLLNPPALALCAAVILCANSGSAPEQRVVPAPPRFAANLAVADQPVLHVPHAAPALQAITIAKAPDGLFYVSGAVNGTQVRFLVDTGANMVVLTADDARRVGLSSGDGRPADSIETAGGRSTMDRVSLGRVSVAGHEVANIDAAVMPNGLKVSLLGQNLLSKLGPITMSGDEITLSSPR
jgi:aspartyl protease family protein